MVVARDYDVYVLPGQTIGVEVTWKNVGIIAFTPRFRINIRQSGMWETFLEGDWADSPEVQPGQSAKVECRKQVPGDWGGGATIDIHLQADAPGFFDANTLKQWDDFLEIPKVEAGWIEIQEATLYQE